MHLLSIALGLLTAPILQSTSHPTTHPRTRDLASSLQRPPTNSIPIAPRFLTVPPSRLVTRDLILSEWLPGWTLAFEDFNAILPGMPAITELAAFYDAVEAHAIAAADLLPYTTTPNVDIALGNLKFRIFCSAAHVPWSFVRDFAQLLKFMTAKNGFTAFYDAQIVNAATGVVVYLSLHLSQVAAAA